MNWELIWAAVSSIAAVLSIVGGVIAWALANVSKRAKADAEAARDAAQRNLAAIERSAAAATEQAEHVRGIGDVLRQSNTPPRLSLDYVKGSLYRLSNNTDNHITVEQIDNIDDFFRIDLKPMTEIDAFHSTDFIIAGANGAPLPGQLVLGLVEEGSPTVVPIPPKR